MEYDILIIGAGMAGLTAAIYARRAGKSVLVLESQVSGGQIISALKVENWPGEQSISGTDLMEKITTQAKAFGAEIKYEKVLNISQSNDTFEIKTEDNIYHARAIILATGTEPRKLSEKQREDAGDRPISYCATCDGALYKDKPVVVVGHGNSAKHEVEYLKNIASKVYQIHHDDPIPKNVAAVFVAIGRIPNTKFLNNFIKLDSDGYVIANENCETSKKGVFVAGDCRTKNLRQLVTAASDGAIAATEAVRYLG